VLAGAQFGIPVFGTMAHSFVQAHESEVAAFRAFAKAFPENAVLLVDTYDTVRGARHAIEAGQGFRLKGVRLDSGDLDALSREVRSLLDAAAMRHAIIFASGNLDEHRVRELVGAGAPIDSYGIGTSLVTSGDAPYLDAVYKLQEYAGRARRKRSTGKATWPGRKQVYRSRAADGTFAGDVVTLQADVQPGEALLAPVMRGGKRLPEPTLPASRQRALEQLAQLPEPLRALEPAAERYRVEISPALRALADEVDRQTAGP
jgi:nicotinate phosphoribosyltransferase